MERKREIIIGDNARIILYVQSHNENWIKGYSELARVSLYRDDKFDTLFEREDTLPQARDLDFIERRLGHLMEWCEWKLRSDIQLTIDYYHEKANILSFVRDNFSEEMLNGQCE